MTSTTQTLKEQTAHLSDKAREELVGYLGDVVAVDSHIEAALDRQLKMAKDDTTAGPSIRSFHDTVRDQRNAMIEMRDEFESSGVGNTIKKVGTDLLGTAAGLIDELRSEGMSKALRDDYTAFNLGAISYTMLLTTAKAMNVPSVADAAERGLTNYAGAIQKINHLLPDVIVKELSGNFASDIRTSVTAEVRQKVDSAWKKTDQAS